MSTPNVNKSLSEIFDVELTDTDKSVEELRIDAKNKDIKSLEDRREYVKKNLVELIEKSKTLLENMSTIANSTEAAKDFEAANRIVQTLVDTNMTLLECEVIHKPVQENLPALNKPSEAQGQITNNTAVFVGSTAELAKYLKTANMNAIDVPSIER